MIHLATDPNASRMAYRPVASDGKGETPDMKRARAGHAWPFLSRDASRPASQDTSKTPTSNSGS